MCTLTYLPWRDGFTFTHNRDERADRPTSQKLVSKKIGIHQVFYPKDLEAQGTWFAFSNRGWAVCLLNGGSKPHQFQTGWRHSRGLIPLALFEYESPQDFYAHYDFKNIEPFTLLIRNQRELCQIIHNENGNELCSKNSNEPHIWASTTLYSKEARKNREMWFEKWLNNSSVKNESEILKFHQTAGEGDLENDLVMARGDFLKTTSITQVSFRGKTAAAYYQDLPTGSEDQREITLQKSYN